MKSENLSSNTENEVLESAASTQAVTAVTSAEKRTDYKSSAFSGMWMKTLFRRNALLAFVGFMAYFSVCIMPLILSFNNFKGVADYYVSTLGSDFSLTPFIACGYSVVLSVMLFNYLHSGPSAAELHSFPVNRGSLFRSTIFTGTVLLLVPVLLTAIAMFIFGLVMPAQTVSFDPETDILSYSVEVIGKGRAVLDPSNVLSALNCFKWFIDTAVGSLFVFAISNLAGIVAGKDIIHALLACLLNTIVLIICALCETYERAFILGSAGGTFIDLSQYSNPFLWYMTKRSGSAEITSIVIMVMFVAAAVLITLITRFLYSRIKLEREQDATVFPAVSDMLVIFLSFCMMSLFGTVSAELAPGAHATYQMVPFLLGCVVGGVPAFVVFRMIADSSVRIMRVRTLITLLVLGLVTAAVLAFTCFDVTGQTDRVPQPSDVERVTVHTMAPFDTDVTLSDTDSIKTLTDLHKAVLEHKDFVEREEFDPDTIKVFINYKMKNGSQLNRKYYVKARTMSDVREVASEFASGEEYTRKVENYLRKVILNAESAGIESSKGYVDTKPEDIRPLIMAYLKDYKKNGSDYYFVLNMNSVTTDTTITFKDDGVGSFNVSPKQQNGDTLDDSLYMTVPFGAEDKHFHKLLKKNGYSEEMIRSEKEYDINNKE